VDSLKAYTAQLFDFFGLFKPPVENCSVNCQEAKGLAPNDSFIKNGQSINGTTVLRGSLSGGKGVWGRHFLRNTLYRKMCPRNPKPPEQSECNVLTEKVFVDNRRLKLATTSLFSAGILHL